MRRTIESESKFKLMTSGSNIMLNYHLFQKLKLIRNCEFNHLINILIKKKRSLCRFVKMIISSMMVIRIMVASGHADGDMC
jgi:hypothetical protein